MRLPLIGFIVIAVFACATSAQAGEPAVELAAPTLTLENFAPTMFGDYKVINTIDVTGGKDVIGTGAFKIGENESPRPQDRIFLNYNYYNGVTDYDYETLGFEKTFLRGDLSAGVRVPFTQSVPSGGSSDAFLGDVSVILKYAPLRNPTTGDTLSFGLVVTTPTSSHPNVRLSSGETVDSTLLQPFIGYLWNWNNFFIHGFTSVLVPTDSRDLKFVFNDVGVGYWLYRSNQNQFLTGVVPTFEVHVNTPYGDFEPGSFTPHNIVDLTGGFTFFLGKNASLGVAVSGPVTDNSEFDIEAIANFNWRF